MSNDKIQTMIDFVKLVESLNLDTNCDAENENELITIFKELNSHFNSTE